MHYLFKIEMVRKGKLRHIPYNNIVQDFLRGVVHDVPFHTSVKRQLHLLSTQICCDLQSSFERHE